MKRPILLVDIERDRESAEAPPVPGSAVDVLARTLWGEAHGCSVRGKEAVAALVMNRVARARARARGGYWWGASVIEVCRRPGQFPCWSAADARCAVVTVEDRAFRICLRIARRAVGGGLGDPTAGATHYHHKLSLPPWARGGEPSAELDELLFYNDVE